MTDDTDREDVQEGGVPDNDPRHIDRAGGLADLVEYVERSEASRRDAERRERITDRNTKKRF